MLLQIQFRCFEDAMQDTVRACAQGASSSRVKRPGGQSRAGLGVGIDDAKAHAHGSCRRYAYGGYSLGCI